MAVKKTTGKKAPVVKKEEVVEKEILEKSKKVSPYGTAVDIMCKTPDMTKDALFKACEKAGVDLESGKGAITTGYSAVRKVVSLLRENKLM